MNTHTHTHRATWVPSRPHKGRGNSGERALARKWILEEVALSSQL